MSSPDYIVEIQGVETPRRQPRPKGGFTGRPWLAVQWKCCRAYSRVYRNRAGTAYEGRCPRCGKPVRAVVGPGGTSERFFVAE